MIDPTDFMQTHARLLDRRRFELLFAGGSAEAAFAALSGYDNPDGGFGHGLEPDLRSSASQPAGALHAFEVLAEAGPATSPLAGALCDWLETASLPDGGLPFALADAGGAGVAPFWAGADPTTSSLHITSAVCGMAHRVARHDATVAGHPWLERATEFCRREIAAIRERPHAIAFMFILQFLEATGETGELERLGAYIPPSGELPVAGGLEDETIRPLDITPRPGGPLRALFDPAVIAADLDRLESEQRDDGGWDVDFRAYSPAAELEWRGYATVKAYTTLTAEGRTARAGAQA
jgi:hypothetical protein